MPVNLVSQFGPILQKCLQNGEDYRKSPPQGPPDDYPKLSDDELRALEQTEHGEDRESERGKTYSEISLVKGEDYRPSIVDLPTVDDLRDIHICGIDGSNQRVQRGAFHLILTRACIVGFRYSQKGEKPFFYREQKDASGIVWVDGNVFNPDKIRFHTLKPATQSEDDSDILDDLRTDDKREYPLMFRYKRGEMKKSPSSYALGVAVKIHQALELLCVGNDALQNVDNMVCIKDGPLFSTSVSKNDTRYGLAPIFAWNKGNTLIACSKRVGDSPLLLESLLNRQSGKILKDAWFPGQTILDSTLKGMGSDSLLLPRVLKPGCRTPLMVAVPIARSGIVEQEPRLKPLSCYYLSRNRPHTYIRMEVPIYKWMEDPESVKQAIKIVAWQHELGHSAPLVQMHADNLCSLTAERKILENQTAAALSRNNLDFLEDYDG